MTAAGSPSDGGVVRYDVRRITAPEDHARWDAFVSRSPQANPFATRAWLSGAAAVSGASFDLWIATKGDEWVAGVPVTTRRRAGLRYYLGLPLAAYSTFVYRPPCGAPSSLTFEHIQVTQLLTDALRGEYRKISLLLSPTIDDVRPWTWAGWRAIPRYTYRLDLSRDLRAADSVRRHVRKCDAAGYTHTLDWDLDRFWPIFEATRGRQGFGMRFGRESFFGLADALRAAGIAWMVTGLSPGGVPAASQIVLSIPGTAGAFMWTAGTRPDQLASGVSAWLMMRIAAEARARGHGFWDLCGADYPSIARFKSELGGDLEHYFQVDAPLGWIERGLGAARRAFSSRDGVRR